MTYYPFPISTLNEPIFGTLRRDSCTRDQYGFSGDGLQAAVICRWRLGSVKFILESHSTLGETVLREVRRDGILFGRAEKQRSECPKHSKSDGQSIAGNRSSPGCDACPFLHLLISKRVTLYRGILRSYSQSHT